MAAPGRGGCIKRLTGGQRPRPPPSWPSHHWINYQTASLRQPHHLQPGPSCCAAQPDLPRTPVIKREKESDSILHTSTTQQAPCISLALKATSKNCNVPFPAHVTDFGKLPTICHRLSDSFFNELIYLHLWGGRPCSLCVCWLVRWKCASLKKMSTYFHLTTSCQATSGSFFKYEIAWDVHSTLMCLYDEW